MAIRKIKHGFVLVILTMLLLLVGCFKSDPNKTLKAKFEEANLLLLLENESTEQIHAPFELVMTFEDHDITWQSNRDAAQISGNRVSITQTNSDIEVDLTATIVVNKETITRTIKLTIIKDGGNGVETRKGTFNRAYPAYYQLGVPLIEDAHVIYINWDGFAHYYLEEFLNSEAGQQSTLRKLKDEGVYFPNLKNTFPSITNPVQNQILSGGTSLITKNIYRYYDKKSNQVIQQQRENEALILPQVTVDAGLSTVSIHMYLAEQYLTGTHKDKLYITADSSNPKVIERNKFGDHFARMEQAIKMVKGEEVLVGGETFVFDVMPRFTIIYADDLDGVGHNELGSYDYPVSSTELGRRANIQTLLTEMDEKLGEFIEAAKARGIYDQLTFFLTTDHGMSPFGSRGSDETEDYGTTKLHKLIEDVKAYNSGYQLQRVQPGQTPAQKTNIVGVSANLNMFMTFRQTVSDNELASFKTYLETLPYVYEVYTRNDLAAQYMDIKDVDILVVPKLHYSFSDTSPLNTISARAQHDTTLPEANHVPGFIWGKGIKKNYLYTDVAYNYDFGITMAAALGVDLPEANGLVLDIFESGR